MTKLTGRGGPGRGQGRHNELKNPQRVTVVLEAEQVQWLDSLSPRDRSATLRRIVDKARQELTGQEKDTNMIIKRHPIPGVYANIYPYVTYNSSKLDVAVSQRIMILPDGKAIKDGKEINPAELIREAEALKAAYEAIMFLQEELRGKKEATE